MEGTLLALAALAAATHAAPLRTLPAANLPYTFELNQGQTDASVQYLARGKGYTLFLTGREAVMALTRNGRAPQDSDSAMVFTETGFTRVLFDGVPAPMIYASAGQTSAIVPHSVHGKANTKLEVERFGVRSNAVIMQVTAASPALFTLNSAGFGPGVIVNQDGSVNVEANAAEPNSVVILYLRHR